MALNKGLPFVAEDMILALLLHYTSQIRAYFLLILTNRHLIFYTNSKQR